MWKRVPRYPPSHARLVRVEDGPPMYRLLGYADQNNENPDLNDPRPPNYDGPCSQPLPHDKQQTHFGPGQYGLPCQPLAFTTAYWDDRNLSNCDQQCARELALRMHHDCEPPERLDAITFPEMAVPGTGVQSKFRNSGCAVVKNLPCPRTRCEEGRLWELLNMSDEAYLYTCDNTLDMGDVLKI